MRTSPRVTSPVQRFCSELHEIFIFVLENSPFTHVFQKQISSLTITIVDPGRSGSMVEITKNIFAPIFSLCTSLIELDLSHRGLTWFRVQFPPTIDPSSKIFFSSSIVRLRVDVGALDDCLYLLDGRLPHLETLIIEIALIGQSDVIADAKVCRRSWGRTLWSYSGRF